MRRPVPVPDEVSKPFWDAVNQRKLLVQYCETDNMLQYPPEKVCSKCGSAANLVWRQVSGRGRINGYIVFHDTRIRLWQAEQPHNLAVVELEEDPGINFFSNLPGTPVDKVPVGARVEVIFEEVAPGQLLPEWRVVS